MENVHEFDKEKQHEIAISVDRIIKEELSEYERNTGLRIAYGVYVHNVRSVGVQGDQRTYERSMELKLQFPNKKIDYDIITRLSTSITNQVPEINRVLCDFFS